jgi:hypothetical protein
VARSWAAQQRLCARFRRLGAGKTSRNVVTVAVARELVVLFVNSSVLCLVARRWGR